MSHRQTALVLGGGFAGLSAAIHLALKGYEVSLIEQNPYLGGKAAEFRQGDFRFDTGPSVFTLPEVITDIFRAAERDLTFSLEPLDLLCRYIFPSGRVWDVYQDLAKTTAQLSQQEAIVYKKVLAEAKKLYEQASRTFVYGQSPSLLALASYGLRYGLRAHPLKTLPQLLDSLGAKGELKNFFLRFATYFGADPYQAPAVLHNICWVELGLGLSYPKGGIYTLVRALEQLARDLGVSFRTSVRVEKLEHKQQRIRQVISSAGNFSADVVVSSLDYVRTHQLLGLSNPLAKKTASLSGFVMLLAVKGETTLKHHTISFAEDYQAEFEAIRKGQLASRPTLYLNISSKTDPADAPAGYENWFLMANAPALAQAENPWSPEAETNYAENLLNLLEQRGLASRKSLDVKQIIGPNRLAKLAFRGSIYGHAPKSLTDTLRPPQRIRGIYNLALAGGTVFPGGGIPLALLSGKAAAELVSKSP